MGSTNILQFLHWLGNPVWSVHISPNLLTPYTQILCVYFSLNACIIPSYWAMEICTHYILVSFSLVIHVCVCAQLCLTLTNPMDYNPPSSSVHGISQAKEWSGLQFLTPGDLPYPGIKSRSPALQADSLSTVPPGNSALLSGMPFWMPSDSKCRNTTHLIWVSKLAGQQEKQS